jgi:hypothetical protein
MDDIGTNGVNVINSFQLGKYTSLEEWISGSLNVVIAIAALIAIIFMVYAGFLYIFSGGETDKVDKAQKTMAYTIVGLILVFIAPLLIKFVMVNFIGYNG